MIYIYQRRAYPGLSQDTEWVNVDPSAEIRSAVDRNHPNVVLRPRFDGGDMYRKIPR